VIFVLNVHGTAILFVTAGIDKETNNYRIVV